MSKLAKVQDFYNHVRKTEGQEVTSKFYESIKEWDGNKGFFNSFYKNDVLYMLLEEAKEN